MEPLLPDDTDEADLVRRARRGDQRAFEQIYHRHARAVHALALRLTGDGGAAEDVTQDAFLRLFSFLGGLRAGAPLRPWLKRVAANLAIDRLRRQRPQRDVPLDDDGFPASGPGPDALAEGDALLRRLPPLVRTVVWLHEMEGWTHPELARRFGQSASWSKSTLARGLARLREGLVVPLPDGGPQDDDHDRD